MRVLVACEFSGVVRDAFKNKGHDAWSCDLLPTEREGQHIQGDVKDALKQKWDLIIAHPPCRYLCNSGVQWVVNRKLWYELDLAVRFFRMFLVHTKCRRIAIENPIPHGYARERIGLEYDQVIQPWWFGHGETKATCLWLKRLPLLRATNKVDGREPRMYQMTRNADVSKNRSRTYTGIAEAMADQWGSN